MAQLHRSRSIGPEPLAAAALTLLFLFLSFVWITIDRRVPLFDSGAHLTWMTYYRDQLMDGDLLGPFQYWNTYPPLVHLVGVAGTLVGGLDVGPAITAQNIVFVPLLAVGCYQVGRLAYGRLAGALAVLFALGTPMVATHFHVFLLDAPEAAIVAITVWLVLASERFSRTSIAAAAGVVCGLGLLTKETFVAFVAGAVAVTVIRGGWKHWRGVFAFLGLAALIGLPWYLVHLGDLTSHASSINTAETSGAAGSIFPTRWSLKNAGWYVWSSLNHQPLAPLLAFSAIGTVWGFARFLRQRSRSDFTPELVVGGLVSWIGITLSMPHDPRYSLPALVFLAVLGTGWITWIRPHAQWVAIGALALIAVVNNLGGSFGVGRRVAVSFPGAPSDSFLRERQLTVYAPAGQAPRRDGDVLGLFRAIEKSGAKAVHWDLAAEAIGSNFSHQGLGAYSAMAGLSGSVTTNYAALGPRDAYLLRFPLNGDSPPPCIRLDDATGLWVRLGNPLRPGVPYFCPLREPAVYGP